MIKFDTVAPAATLTPAKVRVLLLPIKRAGDVIYGTRYAKQLLDYGMCVKVNVLHVTAASHPAEVTQGDALMREAAIYLGRSQLDYSTFIFSGDVVFSILDAAELLNCQEIVLPAVKTGAWPRLFSDDVTGRIARSKRSATVVLADPNGMRCSALAA